MLLFILLVPIYSFSQTVKYRQYKSGETAKYKLTTEVYRNDKFSGKTVSISAHRIVKTENYFSEEIRWLSKVSFTGKDTVFFDSIAKKVSPYKISLSPQGKVLLPKLAIPEMVGEITDLNTFFVAIAPALNIQKLSPGNPTFKNTELRHGNFADSIFILYGTDCLEVTQHLLETTKEYSVVSTNFTPPSSICFKPLLDTISSKISGSPNNFQMIQKGTADKVNLFWGTESFEIITKIDNRNGQIVEASMINILNLRMRYNSSEDLKTYAVEMPVTIRRNLKLELLNL